jgi:hypothetical protein
METQMEEKLRAYEMRMDALFLEKDFPLSKDVLEQAKVSFRFAATALNFLESVAADSLKGQISVRFLRAWFVALRMRLLEMFPAEIRGVECVVGAAYAAAALLAQKEHSTLFHVSSPEATLALRLGAEDDAKFVQMQRRCEESVLRSILDAENFLGEKFPSLFAPPPQFVAQHPQAGYRGSAWVVAGLAMMTRARLCVAVVKHALGLVDARLFKGKSAERRERAAILLDRLLVAGWDRYRTPLFGTETFKILFHDGVSRCATTREAFLHALDDVASGRSERVILLLPDSESLHMWKRELSRLVLPEGMPPELFLHFDEGEQTRSSEIIPCPVRGLSVASAFEEFNTADAGTKEGVDRFTLALRASFVVDTGNVGEVFHGLLGLDGSDGGLHFGVMLGVFERMMDVRAHFAGYRVPVVCRHLAKGLGNAVGKEILPMLLARCWRIERRVPHERLVRGNGSGDVPEWNVENADENGEFPQSAASIMKYRRRGRKDFSFRFEVSGIPWFSHPVSIERCSLLESEDREESESLAKLLRKEVEDGKVPLLLYFMTSPASDEVLPSVGDEGVLDVVGKGRMTRADREALFELHGRNGFVPKWIRSTPVRCPLPETFVPEWGKKVESIFWEPSPSKGLAPCEDSLFLWIDLLGLGTNRNGRIVFLETTQVVGNGVCRSRAVAKLRSALENGRIAFVDEYGISPDWSLSEHRYAETWLSVKDSLAVAGWGACAFGFCANYFARNVKRVLPSDAVVVRDGCNEEHMKIAETIRQQGFEMDLHGKREPLFSVSGRIASRNSLSVEKKEIAELDRQGALLPGRTSRGRRIFTDDTNVLEYERGRGRRNNKQRRGDTAFT